MFQLSKKVEYGLITLRHMAAGQHGHMYTVKDIASHYQIPYELLAKVMQKLAKGGMIASHQGVNGGYVLDCDPSLVTISEIMGVIDGKPNMAIVKCEVHANEEPCVISGTCTIKDPLVKLQGNLNSVLEKMTVTQLL